MGNLTAKAVRLFSHHVRPQGNQMYQDSPTVSSETQSLRH